ncbi:MAG: SDR family NAD(P)-dependent oxidoreductase, partial [Pseudomonadota bacterium]
MTSPLQGRIAVVTGASRGIGYATAKAFGLAGAHVIAIARTKGGLEELDDEIREGGGEATLVPLDLKDGEGIDRLGGAIYERWGKLDILVGNAGLLGHLAPLSHHAPQTFDDLVAVNITANWRLLRSLDPLLRQSDAGRVIFMTAAESFEARPFWGAYAATKAALNTLALTYAKESAHTRVCTTLFDPGPVATQLRARAMPGENKETLTRPQDLTEDLIRLASAEC